MWHAPAARGTVRAAWGERAQRQAQEAETLSQSKLNTTANAHVSSSSMNQSKLNDTHVSSSSYVIHTSFKAEFHRQHPSGSKTYPSL